MKLHFNLIKSAFLVVLLVFSLISKSMGRDNDFVIPFNIRQKVDSYCRSLNTLAQLKSELKNSGTASDPTKTVDSIKKVTAEFENLFSQPHCFVVDDFNCISQNRSQASLMHGITISDYLVSLNSFMNGNKVIYDPSNGVYGLFSFDDLRVTDSVGQARFSVYQIEAEGVMAFDYSDSIYRIPMNRYFTFICYNAAGLWTSEPKICMITEKAVPIQQFYPFEIDITGTTNTGRVDYKSINDSHRVPNQGVSLLLNFRLTSLRNWNSFVLLNTGLQYENRAFGLSSNSYSDSVMNWKNESGSTLYTNGGKISHNLNYNVLSIPINIKLQHESHHFFLYTYFGIRPGFIISETYANPMGTLETTNRISVMKGNVLQSYFLSNVPDLGLKSYNAQIQEERFFKILSGGYQIGVGGGIKLPNPNLRIGVNIEYNRFSINPQRLSVSLGTIKPLNYSNSAFSMESFNGKLGLFYTFNNPSRPFYQQRDYLVSLPEKKQRGIVHILNYNLTKTFPDSLHIKSIQYYIQNTANNDIYQHGTIKTRKSGKLKIFAPENASLVLVKRVNTELTIPDLKTNSVRNLLIVPLSQLNSNKTLEVNSKSLDPITIYVVYKAATDSVNPYIASTFLKIKELFESTMKTSKNFAFVEASKYTWMPLAKKEDLDSLINVMTNQEESGSFKENLISELKKQQLYNRKIDLIFFVNRKEAFIDYISPAISDIQKMPDINENWRNVNIRVMTQYLPDPLNLGIKLQIGIIEKGWNITEMN
jgi:hypothetical protein